MKLRKHNGYTGIDIAISVVVIFIFVSILSTLFYNLNSSSKEIKLQSEATFIAVDEIEKMKNIDFEEIENLSIANGNSQYYPTDTTKEVEEIETRPGFYKRIIIEDYADIDNSKEPGLVKNVKVQIKYMFKGKEQMVELSTVLSKES